MTKETILNLLGQIREAKKREAELPRNTYYLDYDKVLCIPGGRGESRFPYDSDGLVVWLRSTGYIDALESTFTIFPAAIHGEESAVAFFGGVDDGEGGFFPVSVTGASHQPTEKNVERYIVYGIKCAYCITVYGDMIFALRLHNDEEKHIHFSLAAINAGQKEEKIYLASFIEAMLRVGEYEAFWGRMSKFGKYYENGSYILTSKNDTADSLTINKKTVCGVPDKSYHTTSRGDFLGSNGVSIVGARSLFEGRFEKQADSTNTTNLACASDIIHFTAKPDDFIRIEYDLALTHNLDDAVSLLDKAIDEGEIDKALEAATKSESDDFDTLKIRFDGWKDGATTADAFNKFVRSVQKQTSFCAHGKNYAGAFLGIRDVFQQLEGALIWQGEISKKKILTALNFILNTGRPPRMFSLPKDDSATHVHISAEKYIDQGVWIISTVYTYLAYTGDYSVLDEMCGYIYAPEDADWIHAEITPEKTTVLEHLIRIMGYLSSNIDTEYNTNCLRVLFGDWNDALDGLGKTEDPEREFGSGVTVMATLQFYQNCREMSEILAHVGGYDDLIEKYKAFAEKIEKGLEKYAIDTNEKGERRIIHGWGDKLSYKVGSFKDPDGEERYSLTSNSIWAITGFIRRDPSLKASIMDCINAVSSKYGLKTFDKPFSPDCKGVGRIVKIVPGTYENSCAYAHGSLFGTMALFEIGEPERAWKEIEKTIVITHKNATLTSFVMPNSYCENAMYNMDGESMGDWHTGSGCVLMKELIRYGFGIYPNLDGIRIQAPRFFPSDKAEITLNIKGAKLTLTYENTKSGSRKIEACGVTEYEETFDELMGIPVIYIPEKAISENIIIKVTD